MTYRCELWGRASKTNIIIIQRLQSKILRAIVDAPWFVSNLTLHAEFRISFEKYARQEKMRNYRSGIEVHCSPLLEPLLHVHNNRRLKRAWPTDA
jgi:hypothetical protein